MAVWAIADLHLSFGVPEKTMEAFGPKWYGYVEKIKQNWIKRITANDLVLIAGDISWAMRLEEAVIDLGWIASLPGTKVMIRGNHDYWWSSPSKVRALLPSSIHLIQNDVFNWKEYSVGGTRLWDTDEYDFDAYIEFQQTHITSSNSQTQSKKPEQKKIFEREINRLELSLKQLDQNASKRFVMTHYPPISAELKSSRVSALLETYHVNACVFGHLHNVRASHTLFGNHGGISYHLTSCDYIDFKPIQLA